MAVVIPPLPSPLITFYLEYSRLLAVEDAFQRVEALPDTEFSKLASIFYKHNAQRKCALVLVHRHYSLIESDIP